MKIRIDIVSASAKRVEAVDVGPSGATVGEILAVLGIDAKGKDLSVLGEPAALEDRITPEAVATAKAKGESVLSISARPQGS